MKLKIKYFNYYSNVEKFHIEKSSRIISIMIEDYSNVERFHIEKSSRIISIMIQFLVSIRN